MAGDGPTLERPSRLLPTALIEALHETLALKPTDDSQRTAEPEMVKALHAALDARRHRIVVSQSAVGTVKWAGILLQGLCTLVAMAMVHSDNRLACAITLTLFATGIALSLLLIAAYSRPFAGRNFGRTGTTKASDRKRSRYWSSSLASRMGGDLLSRLSLSF
jgi:hypothetical protein